MSAAKIRQLEALAASTTFAGERDAALAAISRLQGRAEESPTPEPALTASQAADKGFAIATLGARLLREEDGVEIYLVPGKGEADEMELFMLWVDYQAGERW
jgi:hypothetical protein